MRTDEDNQAGGCMSTCLTHCDYLDGMSLPAFYCVKFQCFQTLKKKEMLDAEDDRAISIVYLILTLIC